VIPFTEVTLKVWVLVGLGIVTAVYAVEEVLRVQGRHTPLVSRFTLRMSRPSESRRFIAAPIFLSLGIMLALSIYPRNIAYASICVVALGDPVAGFVGRRFGHNHVGRKTLEGFVAGWIVAFLSTLIFVSAVTGVIGSMAGMLMELSGFLDDNLTLPLACGAAMFMVNVLALTPL